MAKVIEVEIEVGSKQALKSLQDLETAQEQLLQQLKETEIGTDEYRRLQKQLKTVSNEVKDLELGFEALDKEQRATALVDTFTGLAGAAAAATGAFTLLGDESEELAEVEKRILGLLAVTSGLRDVSNAVVAANKLLGPSFNELGVAIKSAFTTGTAAANGFKVALSSLGIGIVVTTVVALIENFDTLKESILGVADATALSSEELKTASEEAGKNIAEVEILTAKINDQTLAEADRSAALAELENKYPAYFTNLGTDINNTDALKKAKDKLIDSLIRESKIRALGSKIEAEATKFAEERLVALQGVRDQEAAQLKRQQQLAKAQAGEFVAFGLTQEQTIAGLQKDIAAGQTFIANARVAAQNKIKKINKEEEEAIKAITNAINIETKAIAANGGATTAITAAKTESTKVTKKEKEVKEETNKETEKEIDLLAGRREAFEQDALATEKRYQEESIKLKDRLANNLITQEEYDRLEYEQEQKKLQDLLSLREFYGLETLDLQEQLVDSTLAFKQKEYKETEKVEEAIENVTLARLQAVQSVVGNLSGLFKEGSNAAKAAALTEIAVNTALGFIQGLDIAQKGAKATGPLAPFAFPVFYASQIASVLGAANKAKEILGKGGGTTAPTVSSVGGVPSTGGGGATGAPGGLFDVTRNEIQTSPGNTGAIKTYVLAGDVANRLEANQQIQRRRKF
jgi:hypothetical protein